MTSPRTVEVVIPVFNEGESLEDAIVIGAEHAGSTALGTKEVPYAAAYPLRWGGTAFWRSKRESQNHYSK